MMAGSRGLAWAAPRLAGRTLSQPLTALLGALGPDHPETRQEPSGLDGQRPRDPGPCVPGKPAMAEPAVTSESGTVTTRARAASRAKARMRRMGNSPLGGPG